MPRRLACYLALLLPPGAVAQDAPSPHALVGVAADIQSHLAFVAGTVTFDDSGCVLTVRQIIRPTCTVPMGPQSTIDTIDLSEIRAIDMRTGSHGDVLSFEIDVPLPSVLHTFVNRLTLGREKSLERYVAESDTLFQASDHRSGEVVTDCSGETSPRRMGSVTILLDEPIPSFDVLERQRQACRR